MTTPDLAPVYLDNQPVLLMGDPRPQVAKVMAASGRRAARVGIVRLEEAGDAEGMPLRPEDVIDRTAAPTKPIYLTTVEPDAGASATPELAAVAARIGSGTGGASQFGQHPAPGPTGPGVSGQGNAAGSPQSAYSRTGTDTAQPGMAQQDAQAAGFGDGTGKGTSSGARESGKAVPVAPAPSRMAAGLEDPFGKEGLAGKVEPASGPTPEWEASRLGASRPVRATARSGTASEAQEAEPKPTGPAEG